MLGLKNRMWQETKQNNLLTHFVQMTTRGLNAQATIGIFRYTEAIIRLNDAKKLFTFVVCDPINAKNKATTLAVVVEVIERKYRFNQFIHYGLAFSLKTCSVIYRLENIQLERFWQRLNAMQKVKIRQLCR